MFETLIDKLYKSSNASPDADAVIHKETRLLYRDLWKNVQCVASFLRESKLQKGERVAVLMENSPEYIFVYYGILYAGGVVVALNTSTKSRDLINWINHSDSRYLFADGWHMELEKIRSEKSIKLNVVINAPIQHDSGNYKTALTLRDIISVTSTPSMIEFSESDLAAIIYTSGTTGHPKGVMLSHKNLSANIESILEYLKLSHADSVLNVLPFYYSYGNSVLHTHLAAGGKIVIENSLAFPHNILKRITEETITGFSGVPSTYAILTNRNNLSDYDLSSLRYMTQAGGAMAPSNIAKIRSELPHVKFYVMYGQTEATARLAYLPPEKLDDKLGSIGIPIPGVKLEIRDEKGKPVRAWEVGEIYASGENIMLGYWRDMEETNKVLINGWLKTGDLAHIDDEGYIYIDGRKSDMIKSGAHRISPKEIEETIAELEGVSEVAVVGVTDELMGQLIKAVIVMKQGYKLDKRVIMAHCKSNLAIYKLPKFIEFSSEIPKTASGKIRRFLLQ